MKFVWCFQFKSVLFLRFFLMILKSIKMQWKKRKGGIILGLHGTTSYSDGEASFCIVPFKLKVVYKYEISCLDVNEIDLYQFR